MVAWPAPLNRLRLAGTVRALVRRAVRLDAGQVRVEDIVLPASEPLGNLARDPNQSLRWARPRKKAAAPPLKPGEKGRVFTARDEARSATILFQGDKAPVTLCEAVSLTLEAATDKHAP